MEFATNETLMAAMPHILDAPKTSGEISQLCHRPAFNKREFPNQLTLTRDKGIFGDRWLTQPWLRRADNSPDPRIQVSVLSRRVLDTVLTDPENMVHPGDPIIADLDLSFENLPVGSLLRAGTAVIRVSDEFNEGCVKWKARYGVAAKDWIVRPGHPELRLRGILCEIVEDGVVNVGDQLTKI